MSIGLSGAPLNPTSVLRSAVLSARAPPGFEALAESFPGGIGIDDYYAVGGGESAHIAFDPDDPRLVYATTINGTLTEYDRDTEIRRVIYDLHPPVLDMTGLVVALKRFSSTFTAAFISSGPRAGLAIGIIVVILLQIHL